MSMSAKDLEALSYERLDVYRVAIEFVAVVSPALEKTRRDHAALYDQLRRASLSIPLNIAEAAGKVSSPDRARFYAISPGSAMECGAILDIAAILGTIDAPLIARGKRLLVRLVAMLSKMCR